MIMGTNATVEVEDRPVLFGAELMHAVEECVDDDQGV